MIKRNKGSKRLFSKVESILNLYGVTRKCNESEQEASDCQEFFDADGNLSAVVCLDGSDLIISIDDDTKIQINTLQSMSDLEQELLDDLDEIAAEQNPELDEDDDDEDAEDEEFEEDDDEDKDVDVESKSHRKHEALKHVVKRPVCESKETCIGKVVTLNNEVISLGSVDSKNTDVKEIHISGDLQAKVSKALHEGDLIVVEGNTKKDGSINAKRVVLLKPKDI